MNLKQFAVPALAFCLAAGGLFTARAYGAPQFPPGYGHEHGGWDTPPGEFNDVQRRGFNDGIKGARRDYENNRPPNVNNRDEYRHPDVSHRLREVYRDAFRRGYERAMSRYTHGYGHR
ncbi:MAG: hypothetical protein CXZ00_10790 [Acidobacteria bacterium]|nr:MAG: hypothetical protein CXZ00_10790 [Acidobacteriota bacterium]